MRVMRVILPVPDNPINQAHRDPDRVFSDANKTKLLGLFGVFW